MNILPAYCGIALGRTGGSTSLVPNETNNESLMKILVTIIIIIVNIASKMPLTKYLV